MQCDLKEEIVITIALGLNEFLRVYHCKMTKEIWDILQITHKETTKVKRLMFDILIHEYELFRMKH